MTSLIGKICSLGRDRILWALALLAALSVAYYWHGLGPGDAERYVDAALDWRAGPNLGDTHWALRHLLVLPMAASFSLLGVNEFAATLPNIIFAVALVALTYLCAKFFFGRLEAIIAAGLIAISGFFIARPIEIDVYGVETVLVAAACWVFASAPFSAKRLARLAAAGFLTGLAWTVREQNMFLGVAFGLIVLMERKDFFPRAFALAGGFLAVLAAEMIIYALAAGDPLYRYLTDLNHTTVSPGKLEPLETAGWAKTILRPVKDTLTSPLVLPNLIFAGAGFLILRKDLRQLLSERGRYALSVLIVAALTAAIISSYGFSLTMPRYYPAFAYALFVFLGVLAAALWRRRGVRPASAILSMVAIANVFAADFSRYNEYDEARALAKIAAAIDEPVMTDPMTAFRARYLLTFEGLSREEAFARVTPTKYPTPGGLFFKSYAREIDGSWCVVKTEKSRRDNWAHALVRAVGLDRLIGGHFAATVKKPDDVALVRVPNADAAGGCARAPT